MSKLEERIKAQIRTQGPMRLDAYMHICLADPEYGYYMRRDPFGAGGDFTTAPEITQIFGELLGAFLAVQWQRMGMPRATLMEIGPGRGTLMKDALRATRHVPGFHDVLEIVMVETSPTLEAMQRQALAGAHPRIHWQAAFHAPTKPLLLIANELFDALPIRQFRQHEGVGQERFVTLDEKDDLTWEWLPIPVMPVLCEDDVFEHSEASIALAGAIASHIAGHGGAALIIDYGYAKGHGDTLQALRAHRFHNPLDSPGEADITAHVDFAALAAAAQKAGAAAHGPIPQGRLLKRLGAMERTSQLMQQASDSQKTALLSGLERLTSPDAMGELFKPLCITQPGLPIPEEFR